MNTQHTPGPWDIDDYQGTTSPFIGASGAGNIARCLIPIGGTMATAQANAKLMASCPDMLDALWAVIHAMEDKGGFKTHPAYAMACKVVEKATQ